MKALAVGAAMTLVLGAGATALLMPSASAAVATHGADDTLGHVRHSGADDTLRAPPQQRTVRPAGHGADDTLGHARHSGTDDTAVPLTRSGTSASAEAQSVRPGTVSAPRSARPPQRYRCGGCSSWGSSLPFASALLIGVSVTVTRIPDMVRESPYGVGAGFWPRSAG